MRPATADLMRPTPVRLMRHTLFTLIVFAAPRATLACPVCFGQNDSPMAWGVNMGIFVMLAVTGGVLAGFASFFLDRKSTRLNSSHSDRSRMPSSA